MSVKHFLAMRVQSVSQSRVQRWRGELMVLVLVLLLVSFAVRGCCW